MSLCHNRYHSPMNDQQPPDPSEIDPIWTTSRTARQIYALSQVEKVRVVFVRKVMRSSRRNDRISLASSRSPPHPFPSLRFHKPTVQKIISLRARRDPSSSSSKSVNISNALMCVCDMWYQFSPLPLSSGSLPKLFTVRHLGCTSCSTIITCAYPPFAHCTVSNQCPITQFYPPFSRRRSSSWNGWYFTRQSRSTRREDWTRRMEGCVGSAETSAGPSGCSARYGNVELNSWYEVIMSWDAIMRF